MILKIDLTSIFDEIHSRTYYQGEALKRKDIDMANIQTSLDDTPALRTFAETAINNVSSIMIKRVVNYNFELDSDCIIITFEPHKRIPESDAPNVVKLLSKAITDYAANYIMYEWYLTVAPELASLPESRIMILLDKVNSCIQMLSKPVRRRATDLAGI